VRWENKFRLIVYFLSNICAENYQIRFTYVGAINDDYDDDDDDDNDEIISRRGLMTAYVAWTIKGKGKGCRVLLHEPTRNALLPF